MNILTLLMATIPVLIVCIGGCAAGWRLTYLRALDAEQDLDYALDFIDDLVDNTP